jgi:hypothetical protein
MQEALNPLAIEQGRSPVPVPARGEGGDGLLWAVVAAMAPLICDFVFIVAIDGRPASSISLFHIGVSVFGLTLAALVRIVSHGRGTWLLPILFLLAIVEVLIALYFGGTFSHRWVNPDNITRDIQVVEFSATHGPTATVRSSHLTKVRDDLLAVEEADPKSSKGAYGVLIGLGVFSLVILIGYWRGPTAPERLRRAKARTRAP